MSLTADEVSAFTGLIGDVVGSELLPFRDEVRDFRSEVNASFDALFRRDETREEEYLALRKQIAEPINRELEKRVA